MSLKLIDRLFITQNSKDDHYLMFNPYNDAILEVDNNTFSRIKDNTLSDDERNMLMESGMIKNKNVDEITFTKKWLRDLKYFSRGNRNYVFILTDRCNFACPYCIEKNINPYGDISENVLKNTFQYMYRDAVTNKITDITVTLFGGEPMLVIHKYQDILKSIRESFINNNINFQYSVTTNGSLLTKENIEILRKIGVKKIRVTLDGTREAHNQNRPFKTGSGSYDVIVNNLHNFTGLEYFDIIIGINVSKNNVENIEKLIALIRDLNNNGINITRVEISPVMDNYGESSCNKLMNSFLDNDFMNKMLSLIKYAIDNGLNVKPLTGVTICSMKSNERDIIIGPDGNVYNCPAGVGNDNFQVGSLKDSSYIIFNENYYNRILDENDECMECKYFTFCLGGCGYEAYSQSGSANNKYCLKEYYARAFEDLIRLDYYRISYSQEQ